jgi:hypothetical protein
VLKAGFDCKTFPLPFSFEDSYSILAHVLWSINVLRLTCTIMSSLTGISTVFVTTASVSISTTILYWAVPPSTLTTTYISATTSSPTGATISDPGPVGAFGPRLTGGSIAGIVFAVLFFIAVCICIGLVWSHLQCRWRRNSATHHDPTTTATLTEQISVTAEPEGADEAPSPEHADEALPTSQKQPGSESSLQAPNSNSLSEK